jgi:glycosyltransferase involved in cell wall biosynthesis
MSSAPAPRLSSLSFFLPMYNERANIGRTLDAAEAALAALGLEDYEILIIDDGSTDGCGHVVEARARLNPRIRLVRHAVNQGYGAALRTGFTHATRQVVFYTDSDLPADLGLLARALPLLARADLVIGYRLNRNDILLRTVYSRVYNWLMRALFGVRVRDVNFSFKLVRQRVLQRIHLTAGTVFIDGQLLAEARRHGFTIAEMPVPYQPRRHGRSSFDSPRVAWDTLREMLAYRLQQARPAPEPEVGFEVT